MTRVLVSIALAGLAASVSTADVTDLTGGVLIAHYVPECCLSFLPSEFCEVYYEQEWNITSADEQLNRIDATTYQWSGWYVLAAFAEDKEFCSVVFGVGDYPSNIWGFDTGSTQACFLDDGHPAGLELPTSSWPGPNEGTALATLHTPWSGNYVPIYIFTGYAYGYGYSGIVPLDVNPDRGFGSFTNCEGVPVDFPIAFYGGMGINTDGIYIAPTDGQEHACCFGAECYVMPADSCFVQEGHFYVEWDTCVPNLCPDAIRFACCVGEECQLLIEEDCLFFGGVWLDEYESCLPDLCGPDLRACCSGSSCSLDSWSQCASADGVWLTGVESCSPQPCDGVYLVTPAGDGDLPTIQFAIHAVNDGDIIELANGTFDEPDDRDISFLGKAITVRSQSGNPEECVIDCVGSYGDQARGFEFVSGESLNSVLEGISITGGYRQTGGAILCDGCAPTISNCIITDCEAWFYGYGGGIACYGSDPTISDCLITDCIAYYRGGGIYCYESAPT
ncbi:right-handed parallel beta-helix repeat-containing protein, partial [Candidatus Eisenbacteria bacterium]